MVKRDKLIIFDTTLRDGEQSPGASMSIEQKIQFAAQLQALRVDVIEAGFPVSSQVAFEAVRQISSTVSCTVAALCRAIHKDIEVAIKALRKAKHPRIHTFIATSDIHIKHKLNKSRSEVIKMAVAAVKEAKAFTEDVEFSAEDASRSDRNFLKEVVRAAVEAGATTINLPDTVGYSTPEEYSRLVREIISDYAPSSGVVFSVHCHNDLGLAVANSLAAVQEGARQVECSVNGIGERAGNASLEEVVMAVKVRKDLFRLQTSIDIREIYKTSDLLSRITDIPIPANKAIVGKNAFAHESGIHQDGVLKNRQTYEIIRPESIGWKGVNLVLGRHSGKHALASTLKCMGVNLKTKELEKVYKDFTEIADKKKEVFEEDLAAILGDAFVRRRDHLKLVSVMSTSGTQTVSIGSATIEWKGEVVSQAATGNGPVDAVYNAIDRILYHSVLTKKLPARIKNKKIHLKQYKMNFLVQSTDSMGNAQATLADDRETPYLGQGGIGILLSLRPRLISMPLIAVSRKTARSLKKIKRFKERHWEIKIRETSPSVNSPIGRFGITPGFSRTTPSKNLNSRKMESKFD